uniref:Uncharacterized protein n=1 Tax=Heterorhabditis bacteriophora TaxID=37862 RepID=A0A1I7XDZ8_HETBA
MTAYVPGTVSFRPSQQRGHDITFYLLLNRSELAYEFAFRCINTAETIMTYCCCTFRALNDGAPLAFGKIPYVYILNGHFITHPEYPGNAYLYTPRSSARALAWREATDIANYLSFLSSAEKRAMVKQLTVRPSGSSDTLRRQLSYNRNYMKSAQPVQLIHIDRINLRYVTDNENLLLANGSMIVVGSNILWNAVFHTLDVKLFFGWTLHANLPRIRCWPVEANIVFAEVQNSHALPLFFALIKDSQRATYDLLYKYVIRFNLTI